MWIRISGRAVARWDDTDAEVLVPAVLAGWTAGAATRTLARPPSPNRSRPSGRPTARPASATTGPWGG